MLQGFWLREASASEVEGVKRSHNAIWKWIQRFAPKLFEADRARRPRPRVIVLDETSMNLGGEMVYLHAATIP
jgi:transposase-like protein